MGCGATNASRSAAAASREDTAHADPCVAAAVTVVPAMHSTEYIVPGSIGHGASIPRTSQCSSTGDSSRKSVDTTAIPPTVDESEHSAFESLPREPEQPLAGEYFLVPQPNHSDDEQLVVDPPSKPAPVLLPDAAIDRRCLYGEGDELEFHTPCAMEGREYEKALEFIACVPLLLSLPKAKIPLLVQSMRKVEYLEGEMVISERDVNDRLFIILSGEARASHRDSCGFITLAAGDYFGEQELLHAEDAHATVYATGPALPALVTFSISHADFWRMGLHMHIQLPRRRAVVDLRELRRSSKKSSQSVQKTTEEHELVCAAIRANVDLNSVCPLTADLVEQLSNVASKRNVVAGTAVMQQGDLHGGRFYIVQSGHFDVRASGRASPCVSVSENGRPPSRSGPQNRAWEALVGPGGSFGVQELLYSAPSAATVLAVDDAIVWVIDHSEFSNILRRAFEGRLEGYVSALRNVRLLSGLYHEELLALAEALTEVSYPYGTDITRQGEVGSTFYVLIDGTVAVEQDGLVYDSFSASRASGKANFFGEKELLDPGPRVATVRVDSDSATVLALDKASFDLILEPLDELLHQIEEHGEGRAVAISKTDVRLEEEVTWWSMTSDSGSHLIMPNDLEVNARLGSGVSGYVALVSDRKTKQRYALKRLARNNLQGSWAQRQVLSEKAILQMTCSPFIVGLKQTYRDAEALYFLLELALGGDLLNFLMRTERYGDKHCAQFYSAGVTLALAHLHIRRIIHRDVKPENILLDEHGWPKLTDFGIAKFCIGRTFTVCGTPNYLAPETLNQVGQTDAVDWWALGVFIYEMMAGRTPFECADGSLMKMFATIQRGIEDLETWNWPATFDPELKSVTSGLLQPRPNERLPMRPGGVVNFQSHPWFLEINWSGYEAKASDPPVPPPKLGLGDPLNNTAAPWPFVGDVVYSPGSKTTPSFGIIREPDHDWASSF